MALSGHGSGSEVAVEGTDDAAACLCPERVGAGIIALKLSTRLEVFLDGLYLLHSETVGIEQRVV